MDSRPIAEISSGGFERECLTALQLKKNNEDFLKSKNAIISKVKT